MAILLRDSRVLGLVLAGLAVGCSVKSNSSPDGNSGSGGSTGGDAAASPTNGSDGSADRAGATGGVAGSIDGGAGGVKVLGSKELPGNCALNTELVWLTAGAKELVAVCDRTLGLLPLDGSAFLQLVAPPASVQFMLSLDSSRITFLDAGHLMTAPIGGGMASTLAIDVKLSPLPQVTPDGSRVIYVGPGTATGTENIFSVPTVGGTPVVLYEPGTVIGTFVLSPDGARVFFNDRRFTLFSIPSGGGMAASLGECEGHLPKGIAFSPDGKQIAFMSNTPNSNTSPYQMAIASLDGSAKVGGGSFNTGGSDNYSPSFVPDGSRVVIDWKAVAIPPNRYLDSLSAEGGEASHLALAEKVHFVGVVGKSGANVLFETMTGTASPGLFIITASGGEPTKLSTLNPCALAAAETTVMPVEPISLSPDRTRAVYTDAFGDLTLADLDARTTKKLVVGASGLEGICKARAPQWSPDGSKIVYQRCQTALSTCESIIIEAEGKAITSLGTGMTQVYFSPGSKRAIAMGTGSNGTVVTFDETAAITAIFVGRIASRGTTRPATFPWIDENRFVVQTGTSANDYKISLIDMSN